MPEGGFIVTEGDSITFSASNTSDTASDRSSLSFIWDDPTTEGATQDGFGENYTISFDRPGKFFVNLTVTDDDGKSSTASVIVEVKEKPAEGLFGMNNTLVFGTVLGVVIVMLIGLLMLRGRESSTVPVETKIVQDFGWDNSSPELSQSVPSTQIADATANRGPPLPANGLPEGWTMEQWEYYGEQYLATNPEVAAPVYSEPAPQTYVQPEPVYTQPAPTATFTEPASSLLEKTMVQEPAPTPASQALADLLDDLDI